MASPSRLMSPTNTATTVTVTTGSAGEGSSDSLESDESSSANTSSSPARSTDDRSRAPRITRSRSGQLKEACEHAGTPGKSFDLHVTLPPDPSERRSPPNDLGTPANPSAPRPGSLLRRHSDYPRKISHTKPSLDPKPITSHFVSFKEEDLSKDEMPAPVTKYSRSLTMGAADLRGLKALKSPSSRSRSGFEPASPFQKDLEARWLEAMAKRRRQEEEASPEPRPPRPAQLARFASFSVIDTPRPPPVMASDSMSLLVDDVMPHALSRLMSGRITPKEFQEARALCLPGTWGHRALLWAACFAAFGAAYAKTIIAAVAPSLIEDFDISKSVYGALSGLPAISNMVAGPLGGALIDHMGSDKGCVLFALIVVVGSGCSILALPTQSLALLASSQIIMGVGKGTLTTAQKVFLRLASHPGEMSFFFALSFSLTHLGTFLAFLISPLVERMSSIGYRSSIWASGAVAVFSFLCCLPLLGRLRHVEPFMRRSSKRGQAGFWELEEEEEEISDDVASEEVPWIGEVAAGEDGGEGGREEGPWRRPQLSLEVVERGLSGPGRGGTPVARALAPTSGQWQEAAEGGREGGREGERREEEEEAAAGLFASVHGYPASSTLFSPSVSARSPSVRARRPPSLVARLRRCLGRGLFSLTAAFRQCFSDLLTPPFFFLLVTTFTFYGAFQPLETFAVSYLKAHQGFTSTHASLCASILPSLSVLLSPPMGALVDKELAPFSSARPRSWRRTYLWPPGSTLLWSMLLTALGLVCLLPAPSQALSWIPGFFLVSLGYAFSCASIWTAIPYFVPDRSLGLALGMIHAIDDAAILAVQVEVGRLLDQAREEAEALGSAGEAEVMETLEDLEYERSVLPMLIGLAVVAALATLPVMSALKKKLSAGGLEFA